MSCVPVEQKQEMSLGKPGHTWEAQPVIHASMLGPWALTRDATTAIADKARNFMIV